MTNNECKSLTDNINIGTTTLINDKIPLISIPWIMLNSANNVKLAHIGEVFEITKTDHGFNIAEDPQYFITYNKQNIVNNNFSDESDLGGLLRVDSISNFAFINGNPFVGIHFNNSSRPGSKLLLRWNIDSLKQTINGYIANDMGLLGSKTNFNLMAMMGIKDGQLWTFPDSDSKYLEQSFEQWMTVQACRKTSDETLIELSFNRWHGLHKKCFHYKWFTNANIIQSLDIIEDKCNPESCIPSACIRDEVAYFDVPYECDMLSLSIELADKNSFNTALLKKYARQWYIKTNSRISKTDTGLIINDPTASVNIMRYFETFNSECTTIPKSVLKGGNINRNADIPIIKLLADSFPIFVMVPCNMYKLDNEIAVIPSARYQKVALYLASDKLESKIDPCLPDYSILSEIVDGLTCQQKDAIKSFYSMTDCQLTGANQYLTTYDTGNMATTMGLLLQIAHRTNFSCRMIEELNKNAIISRRNLDNHANLLAVSIDARGVDMASLISGNHHLTKANICPQTTSYNSIIPRFISPQDGYDALGSHTRESSDPVTTESAAIVSEKNQWRFTGERRGYHQYQLTNKNILAEAGRTENEIKILASLVIPSTVFTTQLIRNSDLHQYLQFDAKCPTELLAKLMTMASTNHIKEHTVSDQLRCLLKEQFTLSDTHNLINPSSSYTHTLVQLMYNRRLQWPLFSLMNDVNNIISRIIELEIVDHNSLSTTTKLCSGFDDLHQIEYRLDNVRGCVAIENGVSQYVIGCGYLLEKIEKCSADLKSTYIEIILRYVLNDILKVVDISPLYGITHEKLNCAVRNSPYCSLLKYMNGKNIYYECPR